MTVHYAIATLLVVIGFGAAATFAMEGLEENLTPWVGGFERINAYAYFAWIVVLALTMLRHSHDPAETATEEAPGRETSHTGVAREHLPRDTANT